MSENMRRDKAAGQSDPREATTMMNRERNDDDQQKKREKGKEKIQESVRVLQFKENLSFIGADHSIDHFVIEDGQQVMEALTEAEKQEAEDYFLKVVTTDPSGDECELHLGKMSCGERDIILSNKWGQLVAKNGWKEGDTVEGWWYRHGIDRQLRLRIDAPLPLPPLFFFEKVLQNSDVSDVQRRLLIPKADAQRLMAVLTDEERRKVEIKRNDIFLEVVTAMDGDGGVEYALHLKKWPASGATVLTNEWAKLLAENDLKKADSVQVHGYRQGDGEEFRLKIFIIKKSDQI